MRLAQPADVVVAQRHGHLAKDHGLVLVRQHLFGNLELQVHVLVAEVAEEDVDGLFLPVEPLGLLLLLLGGLGLLRLLLRLLMLRGVVLLLLLLLWVLVWVLLLLLLLLLLVAE